MTLISLPEPFERDFNWMKSYIENPSETIEQVCNSHEENIMVDMYGDVEFCFNMKSLNNGKSIGNIRKHSLQSLWQSHYGHKIRHKMAQCRLACGMLNCHRKETITQKTLFSK